MLKESNIYVPYLEKEFPQLIIIKSTSHKEVIQYFVEGE